MLKWVKGPVLLVGGWVIFFLLLQGMVGTVSNVADNKVDDVPPTKDMGLEYARKIVLKNAGFLNLRTHDASGRGRGLGDARDWKVCGAYILAKDGTLDPVPARAKHNAEIDLGVVLVDEPCGKDPRENTGVNTRPDEGFAMPNFRGVTPAEVVRSVRGEASLRFYSGAGERISSREFSRWRVCSQQLVAGSTFFGQPVAFTAVRFDKGSNGDLPVPNNLDQACPDRGWQGVNGFARSRFPELRNP